MNSRDELKRYLKHIKFKLIGTTSFTRLIEWKIIENLLKIKTAKSDKICDVACGWGRLSLKIAQKGCQVQGIDIDKSAINRAKIFAMTENIKCEFVVGDAEHLPYQSGYFDKVICNCSLEHFQNDIKALKELNRILKQNGYIVLTVDSLSYPGTKDQIRNIHKKQDFVVNYYTSAKLKNKLQEAGFEMICSKYYLNSFVSSFFFELGVTHNWLGNLFEAVSPMVYLLCMVSDTLFGTKDGGYGLAAKAKKVFEIRKCI